MDAVVILGWLFYWLAQAQYATAQLSRTGLYFSVRNAAGETTCITDDPMSKQIVRSFIQCVALCRSIDCCLDFNVIDVGYGGRLECQLFANGPLNFGVRQNCTAYQVILQCFNFLLLFEILILFFQHIKCALIA